MYVYSDGMRLNSMIPFAISWPTFSPPQAHLDHGTRLDILFILMKSKVEDIDRYFLSGMEAFLTIAKEKRNHEFRGIST